MPRFMRNTAVLAKIESAYGADSIPSGATNAILVSNCKDNPLVASNVDRALLRPFFGASEHLVGNAYKEVSFDVEFQSSGTAGTAPGWGPLLRACGFAENDLETPNRIEYVPVSTGQESVTIYYFLDGVVNKLLGARGDMSLDLISGNKPAFKFRFIGIDGGIAADAPGELTLTGFKTPLVITDGNSSDVTLGCTYAAGAISGGTAYKSRGLDIALGNSLNHVPLLGGESCDISGRESTGKLALELTAAQEVSFMATVKAATLSSLGFVHGTTDGYKMLVFAPAGQLINPKHEDIRGRVMCGYDLRLTPTTAGNDELRIVAL